MARTVKNFDNYLKERQKTGSEFIVFGQTIQLPPTLPYDAVLRFSALSKRNENEEVSHDDLFLIFESVIGEKNVDKLKGHVEFDIDLMTEIIQFALEAYGVDQKREQTEDVSSGPKGYDASKIMESP
jgi:hypothetical protein